MSAENKSNREEIDLAIVFISVQDKDSYTCLEMILLGSEKRLEIPDISLLRKSGVSSEKPPNVSKQKESTLYLLLAVCFGKICI